MGKYISWHAAHLVEASRLTFFKDEPGIGAKTHARIDAIPAKIHPIGPYIWATQVDLPPIVEFVVPADYKHLQPRKRRSDLSSG